jgi:hypothetical protein
VQAHLDGVRWLGGGSGSGKTTLARRLAERHDLRVYDTDAVMLDHARRTGAEAPLLRAFEAMTADERWLSRPPRTMLETFHWYAGEGFGLMVDDLRALREAEPGRGVLAEGFRLLPDLVAPLAAPSSAVWLLPSPAFREAVFTDRFSTGGGTWQIVGATSDPPGALANLLARDAMFTDRLRRDCARLHLPALEVDVGEREDALLARVEVVLGLGPVRT